METRLVLVLILVIYQVYGRSVDLEDEDDDRTIDEIISDAAGAQGMTPYFLGDGTVLTELDIELTWEEYLQMIQEQTSGRSKRKAVRNLSKRWTDRTIPYVFGEEGFNDAEKDRVRKAMGIWEENTCIKFRPAETRDRNNIIFFDGKGCSSSVGMMTNPGQQKVNLGGGCKWVKTILHEVGHAIGLNHEQTRPDRDQFLWVRQEFMKDGHQFNSNLKSWDAVNDYGVTYDYSSIMQYGENAFKAENTQEPVMITHDPSWQFRIGKAKMLSFKDIKIVNLMYNCSADSSKEGSCHQHANTDHFDHCGSKQCPGEGFMDKNCQCICPGEPTRLCSTPEPEIETCFDTETGCSKYLKQGRCYNKRGKCAKTCGYCGPKCFNGLEDCDERARRGECKSNPVMMFAQCPKACGICWGVLGEGECKDELPSCAEWASQGRCVKEEKYMSEHCKRSCARC